jgi:hypothetical protein
MSGKLISTVFMNNPSQLKPQKIPRKEAVYLLKLTKQDKRCDYFREKQHAKKVFWLLTLSILF